LNAASSYPQSGVIACVILASSDHRSDTTTPGEYAGPFLDPCHYTHNDYTCNEIEEACHDKTGDDGCRAANAKRVARLFLDALPLHA